MKLISCHVENFGGLHNFDHNFDEGLNIVLEDNGWGKTTFASFLKAMIYGFDSKRSKDITENERRRYLPWQGGKYGGYLVFEAEGKQYRVERTFGETPRLDRAKIIDLSTHMTARINPDELGEYLFHLDANAFQRSVFINQNGILMEGNAASSIHTRLNALVSQANDLAAYDGAVDELTQQIKVYEKTGNRGMLGDVSRSITEKEKIRDQLTVDIQHQDTDRIRIAFIDKQLTELEKVLTEKKKALDKITGEAKKKEATQKMLADLEQQMSPISEQLDQIRNELGGSIPDSDQLEEMRKIREAMGGVLFIDEAYALVPKDGTFDYGNEAIATLIKAMEDHRGEFCVILAGYKNEMLQMITTNPGFKSRIQFELDFPNYSRDELKCITELMLEKRGYTISEDALNKVLDITDIKRKEPNFANAREIRNILDQVIMCQNVRCAGTDDQELGLTDVNKYIADAKINLPMGEGTSSNKILTGEEELDQLIGLATVKRMVKKIKAYAKKNKSESGFNLHMCFFGNPGTGKTEVARIISRILYDAGVLAEAKIVETDAHGLLGQYVGQTAPKTLEKINEAMNGVLFIDEAYGLVSTGTSSGGVTSYGEEAIAVLLKEMEDHRGQFCVILAGYREEMKTMISANPGLESRIQFTLEFPDYTREELGEIAVSFLKKKKYQINDDALNRLLDITEYFRNQENFANARTVRNILDQVVMNQNLRTEDEKDNYTIIIDDVEDYLTDEEIDLKKPAEKKRTIGFA